MIKDIVQDIVESIVVDIIYIVIPPAGDQIFDEDIIPDDYVIPDETIMGGDAPIINISFDVGETVDDLVFASSASISDYLTEADEGTNTLTVFAEDVPVITWRGLRGYEYETCQFPIDSLDMTTGQIKIVVNKELASNDIIQASHGGIIDVENTSDDVTINIIYGTPPAWWLTKYSLASGSYMQIVSGSDQAYQTWTGGALTSIDFFDKIGLGDMVGIKSVKIYGSAMGWV